MRPKSLSLSHRPSISASSVFIKEAQSLYLEDHHLNYPKLQVHCLITIDGTKSFITVGAETEDSQIELLLKEVKGKDLAELIAAGREKLASVASGGGGIAMASAPSAGGGGGAAPAVEAKKEEKKKEK